MRKIFFSERSLCSRFLSVERRVTIANVIFRRRRQSRRRRHWPTSLS